MQELFSLFQDVELQRHMMAFAFGSARIGVFLSFAVFFGPQVSMAVRMPIILALYLPLHPVVFAAMPDINFSSFSQWLFIGALIFKEGLLGFIFALVSSFIFYIALSSGIIIDNQRGASMAQEADPMSGEQSTPMGTALMLAAITLFFTSSGFISLIALFYLSYSWWPVFDFIPAIFSANLPVVIVEDIDFLVEQALLIAAPFVLAALLCDIALGLMNRFAPQLNVFILSMPIKSGVCAFLIILYLDPFYSMFLKLFHHIEEVLITLRMIL